MSVKLPNDQHSLTIEQDQALDIARQMSENYMALIYSEASQIIGRCILQAGLVGRRDTKNLSRLLRTACLGAHRATLEEADKVASEHKETRVLS